MKIRPPFIYGLIFALSLFSMSFLLDSYKAYKFDTDIPVNLESEYQYNEDEILEQILCFSKASGAKIENYSKVDRIFCVNGSGLSIKQFLEKLEQRKIVFIKSISIEKSGNKVVINCKF